MDILKLKLLELSKEVLSEPYNDDFHIIGNIIELPLKKSKIRIGDPVCVYLTNTMFGKYMIIQDMNKFKSTKIYIDHRVKDVSPNWKKLYNYYIELNLSLR